MKQKGIKIIKSQFVKIDEASDIYKIEELSIASKPTITPKKNEKIKKAYFKKPSKPNKVKPSVYKATLKSFNPSLTTGLTTAEVDERIRLSQTNNIKTKSNKKLLFIIAKNVLSVFNVLTIVLAGMLIHAKVNTFPSYLFLFVVVANLLIYIIQEIKAKFVIDGLSLKTKSNVIVIRDGVEVSVSPNEVVLNDIVVLKPGMEIPADLYVREGSIEVNESMLTGESDAILKKTGSSLYAGSFVVSGLCKAQACVVGDNIFLEQISQVAKKYNRPKSQIISSINLLIKILAGIIIVLGGILLWNSIHNFKIGSQAYNDGISSTVGALVGMIPSGLIVLTSMALAIGVVRLSHSNTLVQELSCIETLARVDTLCLDKTGTITDGSMTVTEIINLKESSKLLTPAEAISAILQSSTVVNATDKALAQKFNLKPDLPVIASIPFDSTIKYQAFEFAKHGVYILGAPEFVLKDSYRSIAEKTEKAYRQGARVLVLAHSTGSIKNKKITGSIEAIALITLEDQIRFDAKETIDYFKNAGVSVKVISGDNPVSVSRISQRVGIDNAHKHISLAGMTEEEVKAIANDYTVFGRVNPNQKRWLIQAFKAGGHTVGMTGDGVNDILALKEADTSIAMASGSAAARSVSNMVLLDSNFSSMPKVVKEGRRVINNIKKVATIFLTKTAFSIFLTLITIIMQFASNVNYTYPIKTDQLLLIDWFIVGIPSFFLALEANDQLVKKSSFLSEIIKNALPGAVGIIVSVGMLFLLKFLLNIDVDKSVQQTLILYASISVFLFILFKVCKPFNKARIALFSVMLFAIIGSALFIPKLYNIRPILNFGYAEGTPLNREEKLLLLVIIQLGFPISYIVNNMGLWIGTLRSKLQAIPKKRQKK